MTERKRYEFDVSRFAGLTTSTSLLVGSESAPFFEDATAALDDALSDSRIVVLDGQAHAAYETDWARLYPFTASYTLLAAMQLLALLRFGGGIDWSAPGGWAYLGILLSKGEGAGTSGCSVKRVSLLTGS